MGERRNGGANAGKHIGMLHRLPPYVCLLPAVLFLTACGTEHAADPGLSDSLMVEVLAEVHLADARAAQTGQRRDSLRVAALATFDLDTLDFQRALDYYAAHPDALAPIYTRALDQLVRERRTEQ